MRMLFRAILLIGLLTVGAFSNPANHVNDDGASSSTVDTSTHGKGGGEGRGSGGGSGDARKDHKSRSISPKVFIISLYNMEGESWYGNGAFNLLAHNITVPGLSPLFPDVHCTSDYAICQLITGEAEINAATSITSLVFSDLFDLRQTYFFIAGVAGVNPKVATIASVTFARYAVQVALQYEIDPRDLPNNFSTGYIPQGSTAPDQYPQEIYGTEVFELNNALRGKVIDVARAQRMNLSDSADAKAYRALYAQGPHTINGSNVYAAAAAPPSILACDTATADNFWSGTRFNDAFANYTALVTNGTGVYCTSQQEDNAMLEPLLRADLSNRTDFSRIIIMRTASDFEAPPPGVSDFVNLIYEQAGYIPALKNIPLVGIPIITSIVREWNTTYAKGIKPTNYIGDILGSLGGTPNFGAGSVKEPEPLTTLPFRRRSLKGAKLSRRDPSGKLNILPRMRIN